VKERSREMLALEAAYLAELREQGARIDPQPAEPVSL
jgi:hypothetical protein